MVDESKRPPSFDAESLRTDSWSPRPLEALRFFWFEGLLETASGTRRDIETAAEKIERMELGAAHLDIDGRRARLMMEDGAVAGEKLDDAKRAHFLDGLQDFLDAASDARSGESTLRCTEVFETRVRETLFKPVAGKIETVCRVRTKTPSDDARAPRGIDAPAGIAGLNTRALVIVVALLFTAFGISAWSSGWVDRVLAQKVEELRIERGAFEPMLDVKLSEKWGEYTIEVRRAATYPADPAQVKAALDAAATNTDRACVNAVANGDDVYVLIENAEGRALESRRISLRPLLTKDDAVVDTKIWGRISARTVRLSLDEGTKDLEKK